MYVLDLRPHNLCALPCFGLSFFVFLSAVAGILAAKFKIGAKAWDQHKNELSVIILRMHVIVGYIDLLFGYLACWFGIVAYRNKFEQKNEDFKKEYGILIGCTVWAIAFEIAFQIWKHCSKNEQTVSP